MRRIEKTDRKVGISPPPPPPRAAVRGYSAILRQAYRLITVMVCVAVRPPSHFSHLISLFSGRKNMFNPSSAVHGRDGDDEDCAGSSDPTSMDR